MLLFRKGKVITLNQRINNTRCLTNNMSEAVSKEKVEAVFMALLLQTGDTSKVAAVSNSSTTKVANFSLTTLSDNCSGLFSVNHGVYQYDWHSCSTSQYLVWRWLHFYSIFMPSKTLTSENTYKAQQHEPYVHTTGRANSKGEEYLATCKEKHLTLLCVHSLPPHMHTKKRRNAVCNVVT